MYYASKFWQFNPFEIVENLEVSESSEPNENKSSCIISQKQTQHLSAEA